MDEGMLDPGGTFGTLLLMGVMMLAIASILMAIGLQGKTVFAPLEQLRRAMEQYSTGDLDVRLPERENVSQIGQLYQTFNHMADQIQIYKIDVYEKRAGAAEGAKPFPAGADSAAFLYQYFKSDSWNGTDSGF